MSTTPVADASADGGLLADATATDSTAPDTSTDDAGDAGTTGDASDGGQSLVARGAYLVNAVAACGDCHTPRGATGPDPTKTLAGNPGLFQVPGLAPDGGVGIVSPKNLTPDPVTGIGSWTDAQIKNAFQNGIEANGKALFPIMPYYVYHNMSSADADAIVAYLRTLTPVINAVPPRNFDFAQPAQPIPVAQLPNSTLPSTDANSASAARGKYLAASIGVCLECHSPHVNGPIPLDTTKLFSGSDTFPAAALGLPTPPFPAVIVSANITPDATGLQGWTAGQVVAALKQGVDKGGAPLCPPMPSGPMGAFGHLTDADALDIANYVLHLPPIANTVSPACHDVVAAASSSDAGPHDASPE